jgi:regulator of CtrA degradation
LSGPVALAYAAEAMRLTTRMMQLATWLLLQRAVNKGEMTAAAALAEKRKLNFSQPALVSDEAMLAKLPLRLVRFIETSLRLQARILHLDQLIYKMVELRGQDARLRSSVANQMALLKAAFGLVHLDAGI